ncbi:ABC transporter ATP-binding protein [Serratia proteamaculans]|uniref:ABC transporter ATP-binding protein n=1 Tax=Serratia proteamaculans TaxID=28151 RepID=UPI003CFFA2E5
MNIISIDGVGKAYKKYPTRFSRLFEWLPFFSKKRHSLKWVLKDINIHIKQGESVGIVGVNGAGKSTLLKMVTGTTQPTEGNIVRYGSVAALLELGMGFHPDFTGRQNIYMSGQLLGLSDDKISALMSEIEVFADIGDYIDQPVRVYSSGMQVRLAFSVATAVRPDLLIVDEALSVGDVAFQAKCFRRIKSFKEQGTTILFVTHALDDVVKHCHRAILLDGGKVAMFGEPREVVNEFRDRMFGKTVKRSKPSSDRNFDSELSIEDIYHTKPYYQKIEHRWGNHGATITDVLVSSDRGEFPPTIDTNDFIKIKFRSVFHQDCKRPIFGLLIKTPDGLNIYGTNSEILSGSHYGNVAAGEIIDSEFSLKVIMNSGSYLLSLGITVQDEEGNDIPFDRRYDSLLINIHSDTVFVGICDAQASYKIESA